MMPAAKMLDPIVGLDVHMIQPPGPVPPLPVPHPHTGILFDPFDLAPYIGATVTVGGIPRAVAGSGTKMIPDHIPIGGTFLKPPANDSELFMGSSTVLADGEPFSYLALPLLSCWDIGMPPIPRPPRSLLPSMVLPTTVCMAVPSGVTVGGGPTVSMSALADRIGLGPLMAAYEFAKTGNPMALLGLLGPAMKGAKTLNGKFKFIKKSKCGKGVKLFGGKVSIGGDPVDMVTGEVIDDVLDALEPGGLFRWERLYGSSRCDRRGPLGYGFTHAYEHALELFPQAWRYRGPDGTEVDFDPLSIGRPEADNAGMRIRLLGTKIVELRHGAAPALRFVLPASTRRGEAELTEIVEGARTLTLRRRGARIEGFVEQRSDGTQIRFVLEYDDAERIVALWRHGEGPRACLARYAYDRSQHLLARSQDAQGRQTRYAYDARRRMVGRVDPGGYGFTWRYDARGRCVETRGRDGLWASMFEYLPDARETHELRDGHRFIIRYDANGRVTGQVAPDGSVSTREVDRDGRVVAETDAAGRTMRWRYDAAGAPLDRVDGQGFVFPPESEAPHLEDPMAPRWPQTPYAREVGGETGGARPGWLIGRMHGDAQDDARALVHRRPAEAVAHERLDPLGRVVERTFPNGGREQLSYAHGHHPVVRLDRDGQAWRTLCGRWHLVTEERDPLGNTTGYAYNSREQVTAITNAAGKTTHYAYDAQDRLIEIRRPSGVEEFRVYDAHDRVAEVRDGAGASRVRFAYDARGLETGRVMDGGDAHRLRHDPWGQPIEVSTDRHRVTLDWDGDGTLREDLVDGAGIRRFGDAGDRTTVVLDRFVFHHAALSDGGWEVIGPTGDVHRFARSGRHVLREHVDATQELSCYDAEGRCLGRVRCSIGLDGGTDVHRVDYRYGGEGDLLEVDDRVRGCTRYHVDAAHRLIAEDGPNGRFDYAHDPCGNLVAKPGCLGVVVGDDDQLIRTDEERFAYDPHFQLAERARGEQSVRYRYDALGQLIEMDDGRGEVWTADHDAWGRRLHSGRGRARRRFVWDGERIAAETGPEGRLRIYLYATESARQAFAFVDYESVDAEPADGEVYIVFSDASGLPRRIESESGDCVWSALRADPYGHIEVDPEAVLEYAPRWAGHHLDADTGLHQNRYRDYDPLLGRYLQTDPSGQAGGLNLYAYPSNPLVEVDVLGLSKSCGGSSKGKKGSKKPDKRPSNKQLRKKWEAGKKDPPHHGKPLESLTPTQKQEVCSWHAKQMAFGQNPKRPRQSTYAVGVVKDKKTGKEKLVATSNVPPDYSHPSSKKHAQDNDIDYRENAPPHLKREKIKPKPKDPPKTTLTEYDKPPKKKKDLEDGEGPAKPVEDNPYVKGNKSNPNGKTQHHAEQRMENATGPDEDVVVQSPSQPCCPGCQKALSTPGPDGSTPLDKIPPHKQERPPRRPRKKY